MARQQHAVTFHYRSSVLTICGSPVNTVAIHQPEPFHGERL